MSLMIDHCLKLIRMSITDKKFGWKMKYAPKCLAKGMWNLFSLCGKKIVLANALHVPDMNRNLVSGDLLDKLRIKYVYESSKLILSRNDSFSGKCYSCE